MVRTWIGALLIATGLASPALAQGQLSVDSVIAWLPPNVETLIVAKGRASSRVRRSRRRARRRSSARNGVGSFARRLARLPAVELARHDSPQLQCRAN